MKNYIQITDDLENALKQKEKVSKQLSAQLEYAIGHCKIALNRLREHVIKKGFPDKDSEIYFFKKIKPGVYSKMLFYQAVFELESFRMSLDPKTYKRKLLEQQKGITSYFEEHQVKVRYYRCGFKHLDEKYFTRSEPEIPVQLKNHFSLIDEAFFTWHDHTFSVIMAYDLLADFIRDVLDRLNSANEMRMPVLTSQMHWTGSKVALVELIYALQGSGMIDHGNIGINELAKWFECMFNTDLKDYYRSWIEIKQRKIEPTKFIDLLQTLLRSRIDESGN